MRKFSLIALMAQATES